MIKFGTGGNPNDFYDKKYKASEQMPKYLNEMGLDAYEYECSRGVRISDKKAEEIKFLWSVVPERCSQSSGCRMSFPCCPRGKTRSRQAHQRSSLQFREWCRNILH